VKPCLIPGQKQPGTSIKLIKAVAIKGLELQPPLISSPTRRPDYFHQTAGVVSGKVPSLLAQASQQVRDIIISHPMASSRANAGCALQSP